MPRNNQIATNQATEPDRLLLAHGWAKAVEADNVEREREASELGAHKHRREEKKVAGREAKERPRRNASHSLDSVYAEPPCGDVLDEDAEPAGARGSRPNGAADSPGC